MNDSPIAVAPDDVAESPERNSLLPRPVKQRWHPLRCGLINLYRYDVEEFWFEQGRLLLRGNNGTGKSRVLALQLPFLLDGEISPHRVEPDRDPAKRMEWNLLMNRYPDRLGYTWLEFGRVDAEGRDQFLTLGCGLRAVQGRGVDDRWFFITPKRVGADLFLVGAEHNPLRREQLEETVGREHVYRQARDYRRAVDEALFRLGPRYEPLIELLIRLRQPQLSRQLDERALSQALSDALAPLAPPLVDDTAEAFRGLEADRDELAAVRATHAAVEQFRTTYRLYIRAAARRRTDAVRTANAAYEAAARRMRDATAVRDEAARKCAALRAEMVASEQRQATLEEEVRTLRDSPEMRDARELELARQQAERCEQSRGEAERDARAASDAENQLRAERDEVELRRAGIEREVEEALASVTRMAGAAAFAAQHAACFDAPASAAVSAASIASARRSLEAALHLRGGAIAQLRSLQGLFEKASSDAAAREREVVAAGEALASLREAQQAARLAADDAAAALFDDFAAWRAQLEVLQVPEPNALSDAFDDWIERGAGDSPLRAAAENAQREAERALSGERTRVELREQEISARIEEQRAVLARLESGVHTPPPPPHTRASDREGRAGAPLWRLCDFRPEVATEARAGIEAALEASGLLDAWVQPDGSLIDPDTRDTLLAAPAAQPRNDEPGSTGAHLDRWLTVVVPAPDDGPPAVARETVERILASIGAEPDRGEHWVAADGRWQLGPLRGRWTKSEAEHIGETSRAAARRRHAEALKAEIALLEDDRAAALRLLDGLAARSAALEREFESLPSDQALRECWFGAMRASAALPPALDRLQRAEVASAESRATRDRARERRDADAADVGLAEWIDRLDELRDRFAAYREALAAIWPQQQRLADVRAQRDACDARLERAAADRRERDERHREADLAARTATSRFRTLEATVGEGAQAILERHRGCLARLDEEKRTARSHAERERQHDLERERAEAEIERHAADRERHEGERGEAIERLTRFAELRLLREADAAFEELDLEAPWSTKRGVDVARQAESLLADTAHDDVSWRRHQETIHQHTNLLRDQLVQAGHPLEEHALEDGIAVVRCPFQGRLCTMGELEASLGDDLAARMRLLDEKEREVIENHLLGEVVLELQQLLFDAEKWVQATNQQLASRPTSTGMLLRFQWEADPDGPSGLDSVRRQLLRTRDLWTPEERQGMAEFLQARIRDARDGNQSGSWRDLLATALDYRQWHRFAIERHQEGQWRRLTRRTYGTGSGGEKALALTLPQFAAAAAHYQSADVNAPRLILLDEVFVGIDSDMRAKCMGLLETFDLDFVMTSEREWGCYPTLPGLAIYQLSARAGIDAVVATRWVWNGSQREHIPLPVSAAHAIEPARRPSLSLQLAFGPRNDDGADGS